jgi:dienelactone hydrolase
VRARFLLPLLLVGSAAVDAGVQHVRAAATLQHLAQPTGEAVATEELTIDVEGSSVPARIYWAADRAAPGIVLCHGIHRLGIDEPRLMRFARALAASGVNVLTPRIDALTDYRIDAASVPTIDRATHVLAERLGRSRVAVMGFSFAGGLSLVAASQRETSRAIGLVVAIGAHDELARVTRFFAHGTSPAPDGSTLTMAPHEYGPLVLAYGKADRFFGPEDVAVAREAMRLKLWERHDEAVERAKALSPAGMKRWEELTSANRMALAPLLETLADENAAMFRDASPHGKLGTVRVPVFLLHGAGDSVIPPTETQWLATEVRPEQLRDALVSPLIQHVELHGDPTIVDRFAIVHFLARVIGELDAI